jgi:hypothetical protein
MGLLDRLYGKKTNPKMTMPDCAVERELWEILRIYVRESQAGDPTARETLFYAVRGIASSQDISSNLTKMQDSLESEDSPDFQTEAYLAAITALKQVL